MERNEGCCREKMEEDHGGTGEGGRGVHDMGRGNMRGGGRKLA